MKILTFISVVILSTTPALAGPVAPGFDSQSLGRTDDQFSGAIPLGFAANFFGTTFTSAYVSNNGYLTFGAGQSYYTPTGLGVAYTGNPIIAPFYADVDTNNAASGITSFGTGTYAGHSAFGITWPGVGYYQNHADKVNTFQVILADRSDTGAGNIDIYLNYDGIQWDGTDDTTFATVGYNAGNGVAGSYYQLDGSLTPGAFLDGASNALISGTNDGTPGQYLFTLRDGEVAAPVPEPASLILLVTGLIGGTMTRRRRLFPSFVMAGLVPATHAAPAHISLQR